MPLYIAMFITIIYFVQEAKMLCWETMVSRYVDKNAIWFNSMQVKCAWEHGLCANVCILDHDVTKYKTEYDLMKVPTWNFPQNLDREQSVKRPWKTRETAVKNPWKTTKNVRLFFWLILFGYVVVFSQGFHWFFLNSWSFQAVLALIDLNWLMSSCCCWGCGVYVGFGGVWWVFLYTCQHISQDSQDKHNHYKLIWINTMSFRRSLGNGRLLVERPSLTWPLEGLGHLQICGVGFSPSPPKWDVMGYVEPTFERLSHEKRLGFAARPKHRSSHFQATT